MIQDISHINKITLSSEIKENDWSNMSPIYVDSFTRKKCSTQFIQIEM